jgi:hypothetical protein
MLYISDNISGAPVFAIRDQGAMLLWSLRPARLFSLKLAAPPEGHLVKLPKKPG